MAWTNEDGLYVRFGRERAAKATVAEYTTDGPRRFCEVDISWNLLPLLAANSVIYSREAVLPAGAMIEDVHVNVSADFVGAGTLNVGIVDAVDGTSNADVDYFVVEATEAELVIGHTENVAGWVGTGVDEELVRDSFITVEVNAAQFTAGDGTVRIYWSVPVNSVDTLVQ